MGIETAEGEGPHVLPGHLFAFVEKCVCKNIVRISLDLHVYVFIYIQTSDNANAI